MGHSKKIPSLFPPPPTTPPKKTTRDVSHYDLAIYIEKVLYLKAKEELCKLKYFTMQKYT
jgi:hypothetical protein